MISSFVQTLFLILVFITIGCQAKDACNNSCSSVTLAGATFKVQQINGLSVLTVSVGGYVSETSILQIFSVSINDGKNSNKYYCVRLNYGTAVGVQMKSYLKNSFGRFRIGSTIYRNSIFNCSWTISRADYTWPTSSAGIKLNLEFNPDYELVIQLNNRKIDLTTSTKNLTIYQMNFLKCCNKVYGDDKYQLIIRQTSYSNEFTLLLASDKLSFYDTTVWLTGSDGSEFEFICTTEGIPMIYGYLWTDVYSVNLDSQLYYSNAINISSRLWTWSIPIVINLPLGDYDTRDRVYDLKISNGTKIYHESGISLVSSDSTQFSNIFIVFFAILLNQIV